MHRQFRRIFNLFITLILLCSLGAVTTVGSARHVYGRHYRTARYVRRANHKHRNRRSEMRFRRRVAKRRREQTRQQIKRNLGEIDRQTIRDINGDRQRYHLPRLAIDHQLSRIGNVRSRQLKTYFSHNTRQHEYEVQWLLNQRHINYLYYGENIASSPLGTIDDLAVGPYNDPKDANTRKLTYKARNGRQLANNINNASMYHDAGDQNGHRANDLDRDFKRIGVGVSYDTRDQNYYVAVEFIG